MSQKRIVILLVICVTIVGFHYFIFDFMVPKTASIALPFKWRRIPLRENKETVRGYFGAPARQDLSGDEWTGGGKNNLYVLKIYYVYDSTASSYSIHYRYNKWFSKRDYLVDSGSIR